MMNVIQFSLVFFFTVEFSAAVLMFPMNYPSREMHVEETLHYVAFSEVPVSFSVWWLIRCYEIMLLKNKFVL